MPVSGDPASAVIRVAIPDRVPEVACDVLVAGAGMGGIGAALAVARHGRTVCLTEETDWIGGQATAGGVSALDENRFIEIAGGTREYYRFRSGIRAASGGLSNPGNCYVSALCFEPRIGVDVLAGDDRPASPSRYSGAPRLWRSRRAGAQFASAVAWQFDKRAAVRFRFRWVLDATEMGDLLPLAKLPYVAGSEPKSDTGEPHAAAEPNPGCVQSFTYPFAIERAAIGARITPSPNRRTMMRSASGRISRCA